MAVKRKAAEATPSVVSKAMEHGRQAVGARYLREGITTSPELDLAYALGRGCNFAPVSLVGDLAPGKKAKDGVPRNRAVQYVRGGTTVDPSMKDAPLDVAPLTVDEARALAVEEVSTGLALPIYYLTLEALVGPSALIPTIVEAMEQASLEVWRRPASGFVCRALHGMMLRALPEEAQAARARLLALYESVEARLGYPPTEFGVMLFTRKGIERYGYKYLVKYGSFGTSGDDAPPSPDELVYCDGEGEWVTAQYAELLKLLKYKPRKWMLEPPPSRLIFLGGDPFLEVELSMADKYPGTMQAAALDAYRDFTSPLATACIEKLSVPGSKVQKQALECLEARA